MNQPGEGFLWVHLDIGDKRAQSWLRGQPAIPETARYMFAHVGERQHIEQSDSVIWGAIFDFVQDIGGATENVGHLRFALGERFLVSARRFPLQSTDARRREIESGRRIDAPAALFETIVERVIDAMTIIVGRHIEALDDIEERVLDEEIHDERKKLVQFGARRRGFGNSLECARSSSASKRDRRSIIPTRSGRRPLG